MDLNTKKHKTDEFALMVERTDEVPADNTSKKKMLKLTSALFLVAALVALAVVAGTTDTPSVSDQALEAGDDSGSGGPPMYKPVILMHGFQENTTALQGLVGFITDAHPGTVVQTIPLFENAASVVDIWNQAPVIINLLASVVAADSSYDNGYHLMCHSVGGMVCRTIIETWDDHNVDTYITLVTPHAGLYGSAAGLGGLVPLDTPADEIYKLAYAPPLRNISLVELWHDPATTNNTWLSDNIFLPVINNFPGAANTDRSPVPTRQFKKNFTKLKKFVMFGSSSDEVIFPYQSELFMFYDAELNIQPLTAMPPYTKDLFGLKTLYDSGRAIQNDVPGVTHYAWLHRSDIFHQYLEPLLT